MKIIFSPSKGMKSSKVKNPLQSGEPIFKGKKQFLSNILSELSMEEFGKRFKLKGEMLEKAYHIALNRGSGEEREAVLFYNGLSFRQLELDKYNLDEFSYVKNHVFIPSALYGVLNSLDKIRAYRLDMGIKILDESLYSFWKEEINDFFKEEQCIINLASKEFSQMIDRNKQSNIIDIEFRQQVDGEIKNISAEAKKARGLFLNFMIKNKVVNLLKLKDFNLGGYSISEEESGVNKLVFLKK